MNNLSEARKSAILERKVKDLGWEYRVNPDEINNSGELKYALTEIVQRYFFKNGHQFQEVTDVLGALETARLEFCIKFFEPSQE